MSCTVSDVSEASGQQQYPV